jgi:hypothetical protein
MSRHRAGASSLTNERKSPALPKCNTVRVKCDVVLATIHMGIKVSHATVYYL